MKRHLIVLYTLIIVLLLSGRYAWSHCEWDWVSRISSVGVIIGILIERWNVLAGKQVTIATQPTDRLSILLLCVGTFIAGFGEFLGKLVFACQ